MIKYKQQLLNLNILSVDALGNGSLVGLSLPHLLVLLSSGFLFGVELLDLDLFGLLLVDGLDQDCFVLELVTLGGQVELSVKSSVDLLGGSVLSEESSEDSLSPDPEDLGGHSSLSGTLSLSEPGVSSEPLGFSVSSGSGSGVDNSLLLHDKTILDQLSYGVS